MIKTVQEIIDLPPTKYTGSEKTYMAIADLIEKRFGKKARKRYNPLTNCRSYVQWAALGYKVKEGERALQSITFIEKRDPAGNLIARYPRTVSLFFIDQVERVNA
jgi:hypothetical protein